ncbi:hypothetical protein WJX84_010003 [Apatococcus fuscideae]|uniref:Uncharacterized protein n=1 Tax=Apatococcus fuscideae TaxID=2026836 RepID=A0AAW1STN9_9CHLO
MPFNPHTEEPAPDSPIAALHPQTQPGGQPTLQPGPTGRSLSFSQMPQPSSLAQPHFASSSTRLPRGRPGLDMSHLRPHSETPPDSSSHAFPSTQIDPALPGSIPQQPDLHQQQHSRTHPARQRHVDHALGSEQEAAGSHEHGFPLPEVMVSEQSISSQISDLSAAEQGGAFPSRLGLPLGVTSPVIRAGRLQPTSETILGSHRWLQGQRPLEWGDGDEVTYDLSPPTGISSGISELSQIDEGRGCSEGAESEQRASWSLHGPGGLRGSGREMGQWTSPVVQNPLFAGEPRV